MKQSRRWWQLAALAAVAPLLVLSAVPAASASPVHRAGHAAETGKAYACEQFYFYPYYGGVLEDDDNIVYNDAGDSLTMCLYIVNSTWAEWQLDNIYAGTSSASCLTWNNSAFVFDFIACGEKASQLYSQWYAAGQEVYKYVECDYNGDWMTDTGIGYATELATGASEHNQQFDQVNY